MNHDAAHCLDYDKKKCPKSCYRAQLTHELIVRYDLAGLPMSWMHFEETEHCEKAKGDGSG